MFNAIVGAGAASHCGSGSNQMMRIRLRNTGANTWPGVLNLNTDVLFFFTTA
jgi:hypothetical protein